MILSQCYYKSSFFSRYSLVESEIVHLEDKNEFLMPGLIDTHIHASQFPNNGKDSLKMTSHKLEILFTPLTSNDYIAGNGIFTAYMVQKWFSWFKKSVIGNFLFSSFLMHHIATHNIGLVSYNDDFFVCTFSNVSWGFTCNIIRSRSISSFRSTLSNYKRGQQY